MTDTLLKAVARFRKAAIRKADWTSPPKVDHELHAEMKASWVQLYEAGAEGRAAFKQMLLDPFAEVRGWVAAQLLSEGDTDAIEVLRQSVEEGGRSGHVAEAVLHVWATGRLGSPFAGPSN